MGGESHLAPALRVREGQVAGTIPSPPYPRRVYPAPMENTPWRAPRLSGDANHLMELLLRSGGMRIGPLLRACRMMPTERLVAALRELHERLWVGIVWRSERARRIDSLRERLRDVRRVVTTHTGRHCYPFVPKF